GSTFLKVLEEKNLVIDEYYLFASRNSKGKKIKFMDKEHIIEELTPEIPSQGFTYALFSAGSDISKQYAKEFTKYGTIVIDNSSAFRMDEDVPLVVPEINFDTIKDSKLIANPNCSTIQAMLPLAVLERNYGIKRIVYSTYQAVSGAGKKGIDDLMHTSYGFKEEKFPHKIYGNCIPHIDTFLENGYTKEEMKMINETRKILGNKDLDITATCVRVPVMNCHSETINIELKTDFELETLLQQFSAMENLVVLDDTRFNIYPLNGFADDKDEVFIGRIRRDYSVPYGLNIWVVADNIRKGAASNAVQILEKLLNRCN
ncbi:MAG: aspartate-semialdehyde dehydrogenase, partial [Clostridia bacterium]|nr:aspartate-semialdehyde dehydrogenase [Clostridia bacterium]